MKKLVFTLFLALICSFCFAQSNRIDSLKHKLTVSKPDTNQVTILNALGFEYRQIKPDSALLFCEKALDLARQLNFTRGEIETLTNLSGLFRIEGDIPKSLEFRLKALKVIEAKLPQMDKVDIWNGIGLIYLDINDYSKALAYFRRALASGEEESGNVLANIGRAFMRSKQLDSAWYYIQKAYSQHDQRLYASNFMDMGIIQYQLGKPKLAFNYLHKSIAEGLKTNHRVLSDAYGTISGFFKETNQPDSCIFYAKKGLIEGQTIGYQKGILTNANILAELYESRDLKQTLYYHKIAKVANEELYGVKKIQALQRNIADEQERQRKIEAERIAQENQLKFNSLLAGLGIMFLIGFILYHNNRQKQKANVVLEKTLSTLRSTQAQLIQKEKLASLGELTAGIAHEIQNPLNFVNNFSELSVELVDELKSPLTPDGGIKDGERVDMELMEDIVQNLEKINLHGKRASSIVKGMLEHSRTGTGERVLTDMNTLCDEYLRLSYHGMRAKDNQFNADFELIADRNLPKINVVPQDIGRVLLNLINNAFYAVHQRITLEARHALPLPSPYQPTVTISTNTSGNRIEIRVQDNGTGIPADILPKIFQPFFTTKPTGEGTGLGLSLAYDIVTKGHGGTLEVESIEGEGTTFTVKLPLATS
ncbi:MAG: ATP-binding protein [Spirosomataceae bacterium]